MHINQEAIIATSYIAKDGDGKNICHLSENSLFIRYKGRLTSFELGSIKDIMFGHKMLLFPLIIGGIITPFCVLALLKGIGNPWVLLSGMSFGMLLGYYGYEGSPTMSVITNVKEFDFFINKPTPNLLAFVKYTRQIYKYGGKGKLFYIHLTPKEIETLQSKNTINFKTPKPLLYFEECIHSGNVLFCMDPITIGEHLKMKIINNTIIPMIEGSIKTEYIMSTDS